MIATLEWLCDCHCAALVRVYEGGAPLDGPYVWCVTVAMVAGLPVLKGCDKKPVPGVVRPMRQALREAGFTKYRRIHNGRWRDVDLC